MDQPQPKLTKKRERVLPESSDLQGKVEEFRTYLKSLRGPNGVPIWIDQDFHYNDWAGYQTDSDKQLHKQKIWKFKADTAHYNSSPPWKIAKEQRTTPKKKTTTGTFFCFYLKNCNMIPTINCRQNLELLPYCDVISIEPDSVEENIARGNEAVHT